MEARPREILQYATAVGKVPFSEWMNSIGNENAEVYGTILSRLDRVENGNFGDCVHLRDGVWELRIDVGPGYRVYFGEDGELVVLLLGGTKRTQLKDIKTAKCYWNDYNA